MFEDFEVLDDCEPAGLELPKIKLDVDTLNDLGLGREPDSNAVLKELCRRGVTKRGIDKLPNKQEYYDRIKLELDTFKELGFTDYMLLNWDVISFAKKANIPVGEGRGSAAGSLVLYLLEVVDKDPLKYGLYFERFVSKSRAKRVTDKHGKEFLVGSLAPDVDTDIAHNQRYKVVDYIESQHKGRTARILTYTTFSSRICIKEAAKYFGEFNEEQANMVSDMIPEKHGKVLSLVDAYEESDKFRDWVNENGEIYDQALLFENLNKNNGVHASGIAICSQPIKDVIPLKYTKDDELVTGYDMDDVADLMVKFDILGLRTLSIIDLVCKEVGVDFGDIDTEDNFIYQKLQDFNDPVGLFQISAHTNFEVAKKVKPINIFELSDCVALARPAALPFVDEYVQQKITQQKLGLNDKLDDILSTTKNVMLYQEQTMRVCHEVFGMSLDDAEQLRRAIGKKKEKEIPQWKDKIFKAAEKLDLPIEVAEYFWGVVESSASYQFNLSHSICYAAVAAKTVWLKYKYPKHFYKAILELAKYEADPLEVIGEVSREVKGFGIDILPPRLDKSAMNFSIEGDNIRYGLESIKGVSEKTKQSIASFAKERTVNKYDVFTIAKEYKINIGILSGLIYAGTLGEENRLLMALEAQAFNILTPREKRNFYLIGKEFNYNLLNSIAEARGRRGDDNRLLMTENRFETFKKKFEDYRKIFYENKKFEQLAIWWFEKKLLGYNYSNKLSDCFTGRLDDISAIGASRRWRVVGHVDDLFVKTSQAGNRGVNFTLSDENNQERLLFFDNNRGPKYSEWEEETGGLKKEDIVIVTGSQKWVESIEIVGARGYIKMRDLK